MKELSAQYPRYGCRRIGIFLERDGHRMSPGRAHRLWRAAGLQVPRKWPQMQRGVVQKIILKNAFDKTRRYLDALGGCEFFVRSNTYASIA
jgi:hypothetical protein